MRHQIALAVALLGISSMLCLELMPSRATARAI